MVELHRPGARPDAASVPSVVATTPTGRFHFDIAQARLQLRSSAGRRALAKSVVVQVALALRARLVTFLPPRTQLELVTNVGNLLTRQAVRVVASLDIPDLIAAGITEVDDLAAQVGADRDALRRLSRHLVRRGIFTQPTPSSLGLTAVGELLLSSAPGGRHQYFQLSGVLPRFESALAGMMHSVLTGEPAYAYIHGAGLWEQMGGDPLLTASFDAEMNSHARQIGAALAAHYDWRGVSRIGDVGGGSGALLRILLDHLHDASGTIIEFADAAQRARDAVNDTGFADRCQVVEADFFDHVPAVADAYLLSWILHDWDDDDAVTILRHCRRAASPQGRVLVIEKPYDLAADSDLDIRMLVFFGARERTRREYEMLAVRSGLRVESWTPLVSGFSVMDCRPVD